jgi:hypothetical protein
MNKPGLCGAREVLRWGLLVLAVGASLVAWPAGTRLPAGRVTPDLLSALRGTDHVEITVELTSKWQSATRTNRYSHTVTCVMGTADWYIAGDFLKNAHVEYWCAGTNVVERKVITSSMHLQRAKDFVSQEVLGRNSRVVPGTYPYRGETLVRVRPWTEPFGYGLERVVWLAFCSGRYLDQDDRQIPMPVGPFSLARGYSDKTVVFDSDLGLPKEVRLYAADGQLVCEYEVRKTTNPRGCLLPVEFRLIQYGQPTEGRAPFPGSTTTVVGKVTSIKQGKRPLIPEEGLERIEDRATAALNSPPRVPSPPAPGGSH